MGYFRTEGRAYFSKEKIHLFCQIEEISGSHKYIMNAKVLFVCVHAVRINEISIDNSMMLRMWRVHYPYSDKQMPGRGAPDPVFCV